MTCVNSNHLNMCSMMSAIKKVNNFQFGALKYQKKKIDGLQTLHKSLEYVEL